LWEIGGWALLNYHGGTRWVVQAKDDWIRVISEEEVLMAMHRLKVEGAPDLDVLQV
jgi:hypothetical protein